MNDQLNQEMDLLLEQLKKLNDEFAKALKNDKPFKHSKEIYSQIKTANARLKNYFGRGSTSDLLEKVK